MKQIIKLLAFVYTFIFFNSCREVIKLDLNTGAPQYVIEGVLTDQSKPSSVKITKTLSFYDTSTPDTALVSGAFVTISDNAGVTDTLNEKQKGIYLTKN